MSLLRAITGGLRSLLRKNDVERDLDDELQHYLAMATEAHMRAGLSRDDATRAARVDLGGVNVVKDNVRSAGWEAMVESVIRDLKYAARALRTSPGFAFVAIVTLGAGMGLTTSVLTVSNTVLRQQWPVTDPSRVVAVIGRRGPGLSPFEARYIAARATTLSGLVVNRCLGGLNAECQLSMDAAPVSTDFVSGNYFSVLGVRMQMGRGFVADDDQQDAPRAVAIVSDAMWRARLGADPSIIGREVRFDDVRFTVVGVTAPGFSGTRMEHRDVWIPLSAMLLVRPGQPQVIEQLNDPSSDHSDASIAARLAPGVTIAQAQAELSALNAGFRSEHSFEERDVRVLPTSLFPNPAKLGLARGFFALMFVAVLLVLLLACANVGNLMLARAAARRREIAVRLAMGASRRRVVRQLLTESLLLAVAGGAIGLAIALLLPGQVMARINGPVSWTFSPDVIVVTAAAALVALTCIAFGLAPALHATRVDVSSVLKSGEDSSRRTASGISLRGVLLTVQIAISLLLLVNSGMLIRGIQRGREQDLGFRTNGVAILSFDLPLSYVPARSWAFTRDLMNETRAAGGPPIVFSSTAPLAGAQYTRFRLPEDPPRRERTVAAVDISAGYFGLLGIPIVAGRDLAAADGDDVVLVNESTARDLWPGDNPLGKTIVEATTERRVVGVVKDVNLVNVDRVDHILFRRIGARGVPVLLVRGSTPAIVQSIRAVALRLDSHAEVRVDSIAGNVDRQLGSLRVVATLASVLGVVALVLASVGVFSVFAFVVQQRTREIGIRAALGASPAEVVAIVLRDTTGSIGVGVALGLTAAVGVGRLLASELFGASAFDPIVLLSTAVVLAAAGIVAAYVPARRATRIDPMTALRQD